MSQIERIYGIHRKLAANRTPRLQELIDAFETSRASIVRDLTYMKDRLGAPIVYDRTQGGYRYETGEGREPYELPGFWLTAEEIHSLCLLDELLTQLQTGILAEPLLPVRKKLRTLIKDLPGAKRSLRGTIRILSTGGRPVEPACFRVVASALSERRRLSMDYTSRGRNQRGRRTISPFQLLHYRGAWYVVAWCHSRNELRNFALDSIHSAEVSPEAAVDRPQPQFDEFIGRGFGVFSGPAIGVARLRFSPGHARWVRHEVWHPDQKILEENDGSIVIEVPFSHEQEILMEILRHGADVEVLSPAALRRSAQRELDRALSAYAPRRPARAALDAAMIR